MFQLDDPAQRAIAEADLDRLVSGSAPVLIDEWQHVPAVWERVHGAVDSGAPAGSFLLTGSASPIVAGTHSGGGRIVSLRMRPLSLAERVDVSATVSVAGLLTGDRPGIGGESPMTVEGYTDEILRSGLPGLRGLSERPLRAQLESYLQRVVDRDFPELEHPMRNPAALRRWMAAYAAATATVTSFEKIRNAATGEGGRSQACEDRCAALPRRPRTPLHHRPGARMAAFAQPYRRARPSAEAPPRRSSVRGEVGRSNRSIAAERGVPGTRIARDGTFLGALFESLVTLSIRVYAEAAEATESAYRRSDGVAVVPAALLGP